MPRKSGTARLQEFDIRVTPTDQQHITKEDWMTSGLNEAEVIIVCQEGGEGTEKKLHYHVYLKAKLSESYVSKQCAKIGRATDTIKGNSVYSVRAAHARTIGYVVKEQNVIYTNLEQHFIFEYFKQSEDYVKEKEKLKKRDQRVKENTLKDIVDSIPVDHTTTVDDLIEKILTEYHIRQQKFPNRSQLEVAVMTKIYKHQPRYVRAWYTRNLSFLTT